MLWFYWISGEYSVVLRRTFKGSSRKKSIAAAFGKSSSDGATLFDAVEEGDTKRLRRLIRQGADLEAQNGDGETALFLAASVGDYDAIRILIESGAEVDARSKFSSATALMAAAQNGDRDALRLLIRSGADVNARKRDETSALMMSAMFGHKACIEDLIAAGADIFAKDVHGFMARMFAEGFEECEEVLIEAEHQHEAATHGPHDAATSLKKALTGAGRRTVKKRRAIQKEVTVQAPPAKRK